MAGFINTVDVIGDEALTALIISRSITEYSDNNIFTIGERAFRGCSQLEIVDFPAATNIYGNAFEGCSALTSVNIPSVASIGTSAFYNCSKLASVNIPSVTVIGDDAFRFCYALTSVDLPSVTSIEGDSFGQCLKLTTLIIRNTAQVCTARYADLLSGTKISSGTGYIYVPSALVDSYKAATNWSKYASQFRAIEDYPEICGG